MRGINLRLFLREPLLHFLMMGLALFILFRIVSPGSAGDRRIEVSQAQVDDIASRYASAFKRPPTTGELKGLIETQVRDEIIYREGLSLGLGEDDAVIKRRVRQKYELMAEETQRTDPTDADLSAYLKKYPAEFVQPAMVSFEQIFFDPGTTSPQQVAAAKARLERGADAAAQGQPSMLPAQVDNSAIDLVAKDFGDGFADQVAKAPVGRWFGPVVSGFGVHLVRVSARQAPASPVLDRVRAQVKREWESAERRRARDQEYRKLRAGYDVVVEAKLP